MAAARCRRLFYAGKPMPISPPRFFLHRHNRDVNMPEKLAVILQSSKSIERSDQVPSGRRR
jgi:hypothetical protein